MTTLAVIRSRQKFDDPEWTAKGDKRASVPLDRLETLWINTGTLCNITCRNCYIESSPENDRLVYMTAAEVVPFLIEAASLGTREIGLTGGEPFLNPDILPIIESALTRGFEVLVLTNAMLPMQRPRLKDGLAALNRSHGARLTLRVSLDHHTQELHETERGVGTWDKALAGMDWLSQSGFRLAVAGRTCWGESEADARAGYARLFSQHGWAIDADNAHALTLFPEMDGGHDVPEISIACWGILKKSPSQMMCATSRMVVKRKGAETPVVLPCTLLPYDEAFEMGETLTQSATANDGMFENGAVRLCHPHCARFCVLGGGSCS
jgi:sulfatase maturation enzyme AslB (radical SAM superfamily)